MNETTEVKIDDIILTVDYYYDKGEATVWYYPDGSGHPGSPPSVEIQGVYVDSEVDIYELLSQSIIEHIEETILESYL